jgi:hypothetical protein
MKYLRITGIEQERLVGTVGMLAAIALLAGLGFPAFDDVVTLAIRARHRDQNHSFSLHVRRSAWHSWKWKSRSRTRSSAETGGWNPQARDSNCP